MPLMLAFHAWYQILVSCSDWANVFMLTDSRCCWQCRAFSISFSYNSEKRFLKTRISGYQYKFPCETFRLFLGSKKSKKYACNRLQKEKLSIQNIELSGDPGLVNDGHIYKAIDLQTDVQKAHHYKHASTKSAIKPKNQWIYAKNACYVQLSLVLRECVNHNCTMAFSIYEVFLVAVLSRVVNKPNTQLTSDAG